MEFRSSTLSDSIPANSNIWRYMPLEKFLDLITSHSLYFANAKTLTDQYEVTIPNGLKDRYLKSHSLEEFNEISNKLDEVRSRLFLNCWSLQTGESYALWKIYLGGAKAGVAIKSKYWVVPKTVCAFQESLPVIADKQGHPKELSCPTRAQIHLPNF